MKSNLNDFSFVLLVLQRIEKINLTFFIHTVEALPTTAIFQLILGPPRLLIQQNKREMDLIQLTKILLI